MIKVNVLGMDEAMGDISRYAKGVGERVEQELRTTAQLVRNDAIKNAPVDQGQLRRFIVADPVRNYETAVVSKAKYSEFVEYGTGDLGENPKGDHTTKKRWVYFDELSGEFRIGRPQRPRPFMFPAAEANRADHIRRIKAALSGSSNGGSPPSGSSKVWVNTGSKIYHSEGSQHFGSTQQGRFMTRDEATALGFRAAK